MSSKKTTSSSPIDAFIDLRALMAKWEQAFTQVNVRATWQAYCKIMAEATRETLQPIKGTLVEDKKVYVTLPPSVEAELILSSSGSAERGDLLYTVVARTTLPSGLQNCWVGQELTSPVLEVALMKIIYTLPPHVRDRVLP